MTAGDLRCVDAIQLEVMKNAIQSFVEEMAASLARSAYSTNIKTRMDFSCAIFDDKARMIAQASCQPCHLAALVFSVPRAVEDYGVRNLDSGDGILINDPYKGLTHLNDVCLISPLYYREQIFGYVANVAHHVDIGGGAPGSIAITKDIHQEGLILPGVKILKSGEIDKDLFRFVIANVRGKKETAGDIRAQIAANKLASRRISEFIDKFGLDTVRTAIIDLYDYTERRSRAGLSELPQGNYEGEAYIDDDGLSDDPVRIKVKVTIGGGEAVIDLSGSDEQRRGPMNSTYAQSYAGAVYPIKTLLPTDIPLNDGFYRTVKVIAPEGKVVNSKYPGPIVGGWEVSMKTSEAVFAAFSEAMPERLAAEGKKTVLQVAFGGIDPRRSEPYVFYETIAGGYGARRNKDGPDAVQAYWQNTENSPVEELEVGYPVLLVRYELIPDSGGAGRFRGGLGLRRDYRFRNHESIFTILADTVKFPPKGLTGGLDGAPAQYLLKPDSGDCRLLPSKDTFHVGSDDIVSVQTPGGGGYGNPLERDPELVLQDVRDGKVSVEMAQTVYHVAIKPASLAVDNAATNKLRRSCSVLSAHG